MCKSCLAVLQVIIQGIIKWHKVTAVFSFLYFFIDFLGERIMLRFFFSVMSSRIS